MAWSGYKWNSKRRGCRTNKTETISQMLAVLVWRIFLFISFYFFVFLLIWIIIIKTLQFLFLSYFLDFSSNSIKAIGWKPKTRNLIAKNLIFLKGENVNLLGNMYPYCYNKICMIGYRITFNLFETFLICQTRPVRSYIWPVCSYIRPVCFYTKLVCSCFWQVHPNIRPGRSYIRPVYSPRSRS